MRLPETRLPQTLAFIFAAALVNSTGFAADEPDKEPIAMRLAELDRYWAEVSRSVREGDFEGYKATCHKEGVLVAGTRKNSQPLSEALARWEADFVATKAGKIKANVEFRFSQRIGDESTAHETGIFRYSTIDSEGKNIAEFINFEGLLVKRHNNWKILMEYQKSKATLEEWQALR